jgi:hypothetical protein
MAATPAAQSEMMEAEVVELERCAEIEDERVVDAELRKWEMDGVIGDDNPDSPRLRTLTFCASGR